MSVRDQAIHEATRTRGAGFSAWASLYAGQAIAFAILDLADAVREHSAARPDPPRDEFGRVLPLERRHGGSRRRP